MKAIAYLIIVFLTPTLILANFRYLITNHNFYKSEFKKLGVYSQTDKNVANYQSEKLINYLCCHGEIDTQYFSQREILHLKDVKALIKLANIQLILNIVLLSAAIIILVLKKSAKLLIFASLWGSIVGLIVLAILALSAQVNFDLIFLKVHPVLFKNDLWILPEDASLIKLFPQQFFADFANRIALQTTIELFAILLFAWILRKVKLPAKDSPLQVIK